MFRTEKTMFSPPSSPSPNCAELAIWLAKHSSTLVPKPSTFSFNITKKSYTSSGEASAVVIFVIKLCCLEKVYRSLYLWTYVFSYFGFLLRLSLASKCFYRVMMRLQFGGLTFLLFKFSDMPLSHTGYPDYPDQTIGFHSLCLKRTKINK